METINTEQGEQKVVFSQYLPSPSVLLTHKNAGGSEKSAFDFHNTPKKLFLHHKEIRNLLCRISAESF
ncbi:MAG: hypothetical protein J6U13_11075 [Salinivirgaceae bacterium]|nr:hypothetical protein [Salinivirgaceae bacterium]